MRRTWFAFIVLFVETGAMAQDARSVRCPMRLGIRGDDAPGVVDSVQRRFNVAEFVQAGAEPRLLVQLDVSRADRDDSDFFHFQLCVSAMATPLVGAGPPIALVARRCAKPPRARVDVDMARREAGRLWAERHSSVFVSALEGALRAVSCPQPNPDGRRDAGAGGDVHGPRSGAAHLDGGLGSGSTGKKSELPEPPVIVEDSYWWLMTGGAVGFVLVGGVLFLGLRPWRRRARLPSVFVCYAREDNDHPDPQMRWVARLREQLEPLEKGGLLRVWWDREIPLGARWDQTIQQKLAEVFAAVVLVSPDAMASRYIIDKELPALLEAREKRGLVVIPVGVRPCQADRPFSVEGPDGAVSIRLTDLQWATGDLALSQMDDDAADKTLGLIASSLAERAKAEAAATR